MEILEAIKNRRSIRKYRPDPVDDRTLGIILEAGRWAPSWANTQCWEIVVIRDPALRAKIRNELGNNQAQMTDASLLILFTADLMAWQKDPRRYWQNAPEEVCDLLVNWMGPFHEGREWLQRDEAQRSIGIAMQTLMLVAQDMGYQSCPMIGFDIEKVAELVNLPEDHVMGPMVAIGKGIKDSWPKPGQLPLEELVIENNF